MEAASHDRFLGLRWVLAPVVPNVRASPVRRPRVPGRRRDPPPHQRVASTLFGTREGTPVPSDRVVRQSDDQLDRADGRVRWWHWLGWDEQTPRSALQQRAARMAPALALASALARALLVLPPYGCDRRSAEVRGSRSLLAS